jgi:cytochrome b561
MLQYNKTAKFLHWIMALLIIGLLILGFSMEALENKKFFFWLHKSFGLLALFFVIFRVIWRLTNKYPSLPEGTPKKLGLLAKITVFGLYSLMFFMPISGIILSNSFSRPVPFFNFFDLNLFASNPELGTLVAKLHGLGAFLLTSLILLHLLGGLFHQFVLKDNLLKRLY